MNRRRVHADIARIEALVRPIHPLLITLFITFWQNYCKTGIGVCIFAVDNQP